MKLINEFFQTIADTHNGAVALLENKLRLSNLSAVFIVIITEMIFLNLLISLVV